ncbi:uncharacterized protein LOC132162912 [Corylus avellana]|uniref:uncharacterized protein LOC132162912 n=1 Tax=Corylus avellana TaxID=13451 RepID=UPI00286B87A9|nr:uncharacterized protein LOC132162912 [Corylus avellana]
MEGQVGQLANQVGEREKGKFPSQPIPNPKGQFVIGSSSASTHGQEHMQAITTLRLGKQVDNQVVMPKEATEAAEEKENQDKLAEDTRPDIAIPIAEDPSRKYIPKASYPERLIAPKKAFKRKTNVPNSILGVGFGGQCKSTAIFSICSAGIGRVEIHFNYTSVRRQIVKVPRGIIEDVLIKVDKFYYPLDFIILNTETENAEIQVPIILGQPFECEEVRSTCLIEEIVEKTVNEPYIEDPLGECLIALGSDMKLDILLEQDDALLDSTPKIETETAEITLTSSPDPSSLAVELVKRELKPLPDTLKYKYLDPTESLPVIIVAGLDSD